MCVLGSMQFLCIEQRNVTHTMLYIGCYCSKTGHMRKVRSIVHYQNYERIDQEYLNVNRHWRPTVQLKGPLIDW